MKNLEKSKLKIEIFDEWDPELLLFRHKKRNFTHPFLVPKARKTKNKNTPCNYLFSSFILPFYSPLTYLMFSI